MMDARWQKRLTESSGSLYKWRLKVAKVWHWRIWGVKEYQIFGAKTRKEREPKDKLCRGIASNWLVEEHVDTQERWTKLPTVNSSVADASGVCLQGPSSQQWVQTQLSYITGSRPDLFHILPLRSQQLDWYQIIVLLGDRGTCKYEMLCVPCVFVDVWSRWYAEKQSLQ